MTRGGRRGLPFVGDVPAHWEIRRLGSLGRIWKGNGGSKEDEVPEGVPCVRYGDLYTTHTRFIEKTRSFVSRSAMPNYTPIEYGDVLFAASGETLDEIGKSAVNLIRSEAVCGGDVIAFRPRDGFEARYLVTRSSMRASPPTRTSWTRMARSGSRATRRRSRGRTGSWRRSCRTRTPSGSGCRSSSTS